MFFTLNNLISFSFQASHLPFPSQHSARTLHNSPYNKYLQSTRIVYRRLLDNFHILFFCSIGIHWPHSGNCCTLCIVLIEIERPSIQVSRMYHSNKIIGHLVHARLYLGVRETLVLCFRSFCCVCRKGIERWRDGLWRWLLGGQVRGMSINLKWAKNDNAETTLWRLFLHFLWWFAERRN